MKQLSSAFVVVEETRDVTVCEYVTGDMETIRRFAILWDVDHDERIADAVHVLMADGIMDFIDVIGERKGMVRVWTEYPSMVPSVVTIDGDHWDTTGTADTDCLEHDIRRVFRCGARPFKFGGAQ
jgi:hypothetical protein